MTHYLLKITITEEHLPFCTFDDYFGGDYIPIYLVHLYDGCATILFEGDSKHDDISTLIEGYVLGFEFASGETITKRRAVLIGDMDKINWRSVENWVEEHYEELISGKEVISE